MAKRMFSLFWSNDRRKFNTITLFLSIPLYSFAGGLFVYLSGVLTERTGVFISAVVAAVVVLLYDLIWAEEFRRHDYFFSIISPLIIFLLIEIIAGIISFFLNVVVPFILNVVLPLIGGLIALIILIAILIGLLS